VFSWLYEGIYGEPFNEHHQGPPWVQNVHMWEAPPNGTVSVSQMFPAGAPLEDIAIVRDPLNRYYAAWKSKICCNRTDATDGNRLITELLKLAGLPTSKTTRAPPPPNASSSSAPVKYCLGFKDFAMALRQVHVRGGQEHLDMHLLPQTLTRCKGGAKKLTVEQFAKVAPELSRRYGLRAVVFPHTHAEEQPQTKATDQVRTPTTLESELCAIVAPEYAWIGAAEQFTRRCPSSSFRSLAETRRVALFGSVKSPTVKVASCPGAPEVTLTNEDKVFHEDVLSEIFSKHFAPPPGEVPDLVFLPISCG